MHLLFNYNIVLFWARSNLDFTKSFIESLFCSIRISFTYSLNFFNSIVPVFTVVEQSKWLNQEAAGKEPENCEVNQIHHVATWEEAFLQHLLKNKCHLFAILEQVKSHCIALILANSLGCLFSQSFWKIKWLNVKTTYCNLSVRESKRTGIGK